MLAKQRQNLYINFPHLLHICKGWWATLPTKNKCDPFVRGSGSAKSYSLGWQFLTFPIGVASSKRHINTRLLTLLESCVAAIWQPGFLRIAPHINLRKLAPSWLVILTNELHSTKQQAYYVHDDDEAWYENQTAAFGVYVSCNIAELAAFWTPFQQRNSVRKISDCT